MDFEKSVEMAEVADQSEEVTTGENETEAADQSTEEVNARDYEKDAAYAQMRRANEELESRLAEMEAEAEARAMALEKMGIDDDIEALAQATGTDADDLIAMIEAETATAEKDRELEDLRQELEDIRVQKAMADDLRTIQKINPGIKDLSELGDDYMNYIAAGLTAEQSYYAVQARKTAEEVKPPAAIGKLSQEQADKDFYTEAEVDAMTEEQQSRLWKTIKKSMVKW